MGDNFNATFYSTLRSARPTGMYDTVEMQIITSPRRYAIMHSTAPRFREQTTGTTAPFGTYDVERPMTRAMSPKRYYTFNSSTHRSNPANKGAPDVVYDVDRHLTLTKDVETSPLHYSTLRSAIPRFPKSSHSHGCGPDKVYDTNNRSFTADVLASNQRYSIMKTNTGRFQEQRTSSTTELLGPGAYNPQLSAVYDMRKQKPVTKNQPPFGSARGRWGKSKGW